MPVSRSCSSRRRPAPASGATRWLTPDKALIQLSLRYKTNDHLWFTFFHEAHHILLHGKRQVFLDGDDVAGDQEAEANAFAAGLLIPRDSAARLRTLDPTPAAVEAFAAEVGVAPGLVVGRLQHEGLVPFASRLNSIKLRYEWVVSGE
jgi:HTH-type transcriptional regulator/antitoxin HigA